MRVMSQTELARCTRSELQILLQVIAAELPRLRENSPELRTAHYNLQNIRIALARPEFRPR
ncbi:hypothetical protein Msil_1955 [Methylocella silvestris BL2]|uniref:Uncharacterized protein n=1 Tax=Methylocella silvestris (strain DSM 15510 / CIP 108128 / LMG 27833 / NCIMB 13906 / BL2) TaxID=395965 RepID=B8EPP4_METSB|nr:hypothetical protein [Methylocella silvestris]ACK50898.1 hypothetical protein Msil_1955 [Methylocella silvestris BL2]